MKRIWPFVALAAYVVLIVFVEAHHEPWRDEADPWLLARDADLFTFFHRMGLTGTPGLWHVVLLPLARLGLPYASQACLHIVIAACTAALILWRAPFPAVVRIALVFSYFFAYEYAVIVRSYALGVFLLLLIAATYPRRYERPVAWGIAVALLANTNTHSLIIAAMIGLAFLVDGVARREPRRAIAIGAALMVAGGLAAAIQLYPPPDAIVQGAVMRFTPNAVPMVLGEAFLPRAPLRGTAAIGGAVLALCAYAVRRNRSALLVLCASCAGLFYVFTFKWIGGLRHSGFILLVAIYALWTAETDDPDASRRERSIAYGALTITLFGSILTNAAVSRMDTLYAFSGAEEMATFIRAANLDRVPIAAHSETTTSALCPWIREPLWYAGSQRTGTFNLWDQRFERGLEVTYPAAVAAAQQHFAGRDYLLLLNVEMPDPPAHGFRLVYANRRPVFEKTDERYWLYAPLVR